MLRQFLILIVLAFLAVPSASTQADGPRLALVIEQTNYGNELSRIALAKSESDLIESALEETGFAITRHRDLKKKDLADALDSFRGRLERAGPSAIGFVYYTGHGSQHPQSEDSYLLGVDARLQSASDLAVYGIDMQSQRDGFAATGAAAVFLIFDACRNVPAVPGWKSGTKGLARVDAKADMLIAFSTSLNDLAQEGVYAPILAEEIRRAGQTAESAFAAAQRRVAVATGRKQLPWTNNLLYNEICFAGCTPSASTVSSRPSPTPSAPVSTSRRVGEAFRDVFTSGSGQGPDMVVLPSGSFMMGSPTGEEGSYVNEGPQRTVRIGYEFAVGKYEVTWGQYSACVSAGACPSAKDDGYGQGSRPVTNVSWEDAKKYAAWVSGQTGQTYRLLTEAEWEYAARAGSDTRWSFGGDQSRLSSFGWYSSNINGGPQPAGGKGANAFGLHDMHGNVWEWVEDCYGVGYSAQPSDGSAFTKSSCSDRVIRGGSWVDPPQFLRSASRAGLTPGDRAVSLGFRLARTLP